MRVVMVTSPTCVKCKYLKPVLTEYFEDKKSITFDILDAMSGSEEVTSLINTYHIRTVPFFIFYKDDGEVKGTYIGEISIPEIENIVKEEM